MRIHLHPQHRTVEFRGRRSAGKMLREYETLVREVETKRARELRLSS
jgi:ribosomal protein L15E